MSSKDNSIQREEFVIKVGPLLRRVIDEQRKILEEITYGVDNGSDFIAGEIIAKKILGLI